MKLNYKIFKFKKFTNKSVYKILSVISILIFIFLITTYFNNDKIKSLIDDKKYYIIFVNRFYNTNN